MGNESTDWFLSGEPWVRYAALTELLGRSDNDDEVIAARADIATDERVKLIIADLQDWPEPALKSHKTAHHPLHKLVFLADIGLNANDPGIETIIKRVKSYRSEEGPFQILVNIPTRFGGSGEDEPAWMLCDAPLVVYALAKFGIAEDTDVIRAAEYLSSLVRDNGFPCAATSRLGKFRGPGRKDDPCPYANLVILRMLSQFEHLRESGVANSAIETLLGLWEHRAERKPYLFAMGTDFKKLKAPLIWFDILHVADILSHFPQATADPRFKEIIQIIKDKADADERYTPESIWMTWKSFDFGQKKEPSQWLTLLATRILNRIKAL